MARRVHRGGGARRNRCRGGASGLTGEASAARASADRAALRAPSRPSRRRPVHLDERGLVLGREREIEHVAHVLHGLLEALVASLARRCSRPGAGGLGARRCGAWGRWRRRGRRGGGLGLVRRGERGRGRIDRSGEDFRSLHGISGSHAVDSGRAGGLVTVSPPGGLGGAVAGSGSRVARGAPAPGPFDRLREEPARPRAGRHLCRPVARHQRMMAGSSIVKHSTDDAAYLIALYQNCEI